nr:MAG TPA: hypothetical protein [Bacteriophage sp.]
MKFPLLYIRSCPKRAVGRFENPSKWAVLIPR